MCWEGFSGIRTAIVFGKLQEKASLAWRIVVRAVQKFWAIDGEQRAAAFAFYAFFSLFPVVLLFVTVGSLFVDRERAASEVIAYVESYVPLGPDMRRNVFDLIAGVVQSRSQLGVAAVAVLFWSSLQFFNALIRAVTRAWGSEVHSWWRLPLKSSLLLGVMASAMVFGISLPVLTEIVRKWFLAKAGWTDLLFRMLGLGLQVLVLFYGLSLFFKLAPRHRTHFAEVWPTALLISLLLRFLERLFVVYLENFSRYNALYGALGGIMALLMWIYLSGCLLVFGACLCAAGRAETEARGVGA